jgi:hypothetical protein
MAEFQIDLLCINDKHGLAIKQSFHRFYRWWFAHRGSGFPAAILINFGRSDRGWKAAPTHKSRLQASMRIDEI